MTTRLDRLKALAIGLYGERWQRATARAVGVDHKQLRRWVKSPHVSEPEDEHLARMRILATQRVQELRNALALADRYICPHCGSNLARVACMCGS